MGGEGGDNNNNSGGGEETRNVNINVRCSNGSKFTVGIDLDATVAGFKAVLAESSDIPADQQRLIYKGRILKDDQTLSSYGLQADHTVHLVRGFAPNASNPPATPNTPNPTPANVGSNDSNAFGSPLFPGLGLNAGLPEFEQVQQQMTQNPNMIREMMNTPAIQSLMNNPELMRSLIMNNPQMREIIDRNPELGHVLNDPSILRQTLEAARNPELMREMMRNTDRAMSNIESSPEGFNALRRMYENVQEPFLNATTASETGSNPFAALLGGTQNRDGSNNPSSNVAETNMGSTVPNSNPLPNPWGSAGGPQANTTARSNPTGDTNTRPSGIGGLGGLGLPGMDPSSMGQLLQNPAFSQMMQSMLSNPQYLNQFIGTNPQLRSMLDMNPQLREMMQNPEILRQLTSPEMMQQMMGVQQTLMSQLNRQQSTQGATQTGGAQGTQNNSGLDMLMNMFGGLGAGGLTMPNTQPDVPPEELYATQLSQLQEMGFFDTQENIRALRATSGNVHAAVERLLGPQANTTARSNPTGDTNTRPSGIGGLGGLGLPGMDPSSMGQLLQNPAFSQMMQSMLSNPQYLNQFIGTNPQLRSMLDMNPQLREMMQNPEILRQLTSPEMMQQMMGVQQTLMSQLNRQQSTQGATQTGGAQGTQNNSGLDMLMNMFGGLGAGGLTMPNTQPDVPPEELYATQLSQLQEMGFFDTQENIRALRATSGNVHAAVERLLGNLG